MAFSDNRVFFSRSTFQVLMVLAALKKAKYTDLASKSFLFWFSCSCRFSATDE